ncbi:hypothetical protein E4T56_gene16258 [Termitomyces sp. T112]|nr:hypothetical protein E4T56_gene16258 [Termitomyces sp. T112]
MKRAEEGAGDSLSLPDFLLSHSGCKKAFDSFQTRIARETTPEAMPMSSLPSPPVSSPTSVSAVASQSPPNKEPFLASQLTIDNIHLTSPHKRYSPPTFASLSSPTESQIDEMMIDPPTPTFDSLVAKAISVDKGKSKPRSSLSPGPVYDLPSSSQNSPASSNNSSLESSRSLESSTSHEFVEQQLTQSMNIEEDSYDHRYSSQGGLHHQDQPTLSIIPGVMNEHTTPMPVRRQAWYGTLPSRRSSLAMPLGLGVGSETQNSTELQTFNLTPSLSKATVNTVPEHAFRSGTLQVSPSVNGRPPASSQSQPYSQTQSQSSSSSQASSLEYASYPLQTQAPYQSQSYTP